MDEKKYLDLQGLQRYDEKIKELIKKVEDAAKQDLNNALEWGALGETK